MRWAVVLFALSAASCSRPLYSGPRGSGTVGGTFDGAPVVVEDVVALQTVAGGETIVSVQFIDVPDFCATSFLKRTGPATPTTLMLLVANPKGAVAPAAYAIADPLHPVNDAALHAQAVRSNLSADPAITGGSSRSASGGTVTFTTITPTRVVGTFEATFAAESRGAGGTVHGSFDAPVCPTR